MVRHHRIRFLAWMILVGLLSDCASAEAKPDGEANLARKKLGASKGKAFEKRAARVRPIGPTAAAAFVGKVPIVGGSVLVGTGAKHLVPAAPWSLVDLRTGAVKAKVSGVGDGSVAAKVAAITITERGKARPGLLQLTDGKIIPLEAVLPDGKLAAEARILVDEKRPLVWVVGRGAGDRVYEGFWKDLSNGKVAIESPLGFWPTYLSNKASLQAWRDSPDGASGACDRVVIETGEPARCRPLTGTNAPPFDVIDDCARSAEGGGIVDDCLGKTLVPRCGGRSRQLVISSEPPAALLACNEAGKPSRLTLWTPSGTASWDAEPGDTWSAPAELGPRSSYGLESLIKVGAPVRRWLDLKRRVLFEAPPMIPLQLSEHREVRRRLVQPLDKLNELWLVDLDAGTLERVAEDIDCDAPLFEYARTGDRLTMECLPKAAASTLYSDDRRLASWRWMEVVDLKARTRWRTTEVFEARIGEDGTVVGTRRGKPAQAAVLETP